VDFTACAVGDALLPLALVDDTASFDELALSAFRALLECAFIDITGCGDFFALALRPTLVPCSLISLPIGHGHLASPVSLAVLEFALIHVTILQRKLALSVGSTVALKSKIDVTACCLNFSWFFCHLLA